MARITVDLKADISDVHEFLDYLQAQTAWWPNDRRESLRIDLERVIESGKAVEVVHKGHRLTVMTGAGLLDVLRAHGIGPILPGNME